ncbi:transcriptional regulator, PadR family [Amycolatopsis marina]|uniref:Transcriptional regulator, PadR family n=2 Tax=Amycolatopsis marina TaxID=490629 RepID=A0A1I0WLU4_9PSEU|nr:transcriptional regulator, PadR family [Amycolatopsis marina]
MRPPFAGHGFDRHAPHRHGGFGPMPPVPPGWGGPHGGRGRGPGGRRGRRGDVRLAILTLLAEQPRHGYEIISEIGERSNGLWRPSPGSIYPTLQLLADEGLVVSNEAGGKRLFELTDEGRTAVAKQESKPPWEHMTQDADPIDVELRKAAGALMGAMHQVSTAASAAQKAKAVSVINEARRALYGILGEIEESGPAE